MTLDLKGSRQRGIVNPTKKKKKKKPTKYMLTKLVFNFLANELAELLEVAESRGTKPE